jgi:hypothetical protein
MPKLHPVRLGLAQLLCLLATAAGCGSGHGGSGNTISPAGGVYTFANGITMEVPPGAVATETPFDLRSLAPEESAFLLLALNLGPEDLLFAIAGTDGVTFMKDVTVTIPVSVPLDGVSAVVHQLDLPTQTFSQPRATLRLDPAAGTAVLSVGHFCGLGVVVRRELRRGKEECKTPETACRCLRVDEQQEDTGNSCSLPGGACQVISISATYTFVDCPTKPVESYLVEEVSPSCTPTMTLTPGKAYLPTGDQTEITARLNVGCGPLATQEVHFDLAGVGALTVSDQVSDASGKARTTFQAGAVEGQATVAASANVTYFTEHVVYNGQVQKAETASASLIAGTYLQVGTFPTLSVTAAATTLKPGESTSISAQVVYSGTPVADQVVQFAVSGPATVSPGSAVTTEAAAATTTLTAGATKGTAVVTATCTAKVKTAVGTTLEVPLSGSLQITIADQAQVEQWTGSFKSTGSYEIDRYQDVFFDAELSGTFQVTVNDPTCPARLAGYMGGQQLDVFNICGSGHAVPVLSTHSNDPYCWAHDFSPVPFDLLLYGSTLQGLGWNLNVVETWPRPPEFCTYTATCCYEDADCKDSLPQQTLVNCGIDSLLGFGYGGTGTAYGLSFDQLTSPFTVTATWNPETKITGGYTFTMARTQ